MTIREPSNGVVHTSTNANARSNRQIAVYPGAPSVTPSQPEPKVPQARVPAKGPYPHIRDLQTEFGTKIQAHSAAVPVRTLLGIAQASVDRVDTDVTYKRPELAFVEYLVSSEILLNLIPRHKDFPSLKTGRDQWGKLYTSLRERNDSQNGMFEEIKKMIIDDNAKNGTRPSSEALTATGPLTNGRPRSSDGRARPGSVPDTSGRRQSTTDELFFSHTSMSSPPPSNVRPPPAQAQPQQNGISRRERPVVHSKPDELHARPISRNGPSLSASGDPLSQRFSQLRIQQRTESIAQNGERRPSRSNHLYEMPSPTEFTKSSSESSSNVASHTPSSSREPNPPSKPSGPRTMPAPTHVPPPPPKIPLDSSSEISLPRAPAPAYDPSKSMVTPINTNVSTLNRKPVAAEYQQSPQSAKRSPGISYLSNGHSQQSRPTSLTPRPQPRQTSITAAELYEDLRTKSVLVIDVRSRAEFDDGHVHARSILCIEPVGLSSGMSAEDLEDGLVISPEAEQTMFERRNEFDLVVYYDQHTKSDRFLQGPPTRTEANTLRALHDTLYEFNDYKPLRNPPVVLAGGLDAWMDLVGPQALATSKTIGLLGSTAARKPNRKLGRPIGRVPVASANSSLEVRKRRLREQNTLNPDEEKKWLETAKSEEVNPVDYQDAQSDGDADSNGEEPPSPFIHSYEDFLRRFPEASSVQQSMSVSMPSPPPLPPPPARIPPSRPPPPPLPSIPSRPAPAVPRPSYGGVSEQSLQSSPASRQSSSSQHPLFTPRSTSRFLKLPHTGLVNFGVTCYMNATIQCLLATIPLSQLFLDNRWRDYLQKNWKGSNGILPGIFANLIRSLWCDDCAAIRPTSLRSLCGRLKQEWGVDRQQDAKEFLEFVVDCLHEDLNVHFERTPLRPLKAKEEMSREHMPIHQVSDIEWNRYSHREQSPISDFFAGQHASRLRCTTCKNTSTTYEAFYSISVEIPRASRKSGWDIHDCLRSYCQEEKLSKDEMWKCPHCKCQREATKQITITRAPNFLVVHFKRFEMRKGESAKKIHTPIHFPLFGLDVGNYMIPPASVREQQADPNHVPQLATTGPYLYDAYAVMRHLGSSGNGGHYISLVRDMSRGCWRKFDDDRVTDFDPAKMKSSDRLQNEQAYLVFFCRASAR